MRYATTFSGIGGWEIGLNACGWEFQWQCECDPWCRRLLAERFGVPIYSDIRTICDEKPPPVDALIGSAPCQPFSSAGKRRGDSDERHLYPSFIKLVAQIQPRWVLMEQVPSILTISNGRLFGQYIGGLVALGYSVIWHCIPACAVGSPQERDRVWIIANTNCDGLEAHSNEKGLRKQANNESYTRYFSSICSSGNWSGSRPLGAVPMGVGDGIPNVLASIKAYGNAVVPTIPFILGQAINEIETPNPNPR